MIPLATIADRASIIVQAPTTIVCDIPTNDDAAGYVQFFANADGTTTPIYVIHLRPDICDTLEDPLSAPPAALGEAMVSLTHEALHLRNDDLDEAHVECQAVLNQWQLVRQFKLPARIARAAMEAGVAFDATLGDVYHREVCA